MTKPVEIWIDAIDFENKGGWKEDTQFVHLMGSGYLIAADIPGVPVEDAKVTVEIPQKDTYRIWVRDRNWYRPHNPGKFTLLVNGEGNGTELGALPSDAWVWEIAGDYELEAGKAELTLRDLTGYFGRCAAILITNDFDYTPPREVERMHKDRARIRGLSYAVRDGGHYDVIVAGGGPGGVPAAIAAARKGMKTLLIHNRPMLGGNGSTEIGITFDGAEVAHPQAREGGIAEEIRRLRDRVDTNIGDWTEAMEQLVAAEPNITVVRSSHVCGVTMKNDTVIGGVTVLNILELTRSAYTADVFIDCTGDGWLGYYAGAKYRFGREAAWQHGENIAPDAADTMTMSGCIRGGNLPFFFDVEEDVEYHAPEWVPKLPEDEKEFGRVIQTPRMYWWLEAPNTYDDMYDGEQTRDALFMVILGYLNHLKNHWSGRDGFQKKLFRFASVIDGRRESRRLIGDYILTQDDCTSGRAFDDAVSYSGWALDVHHPEGIYSGKKGPLYCALPVQLPKIPYRCLYSVNIDNLLFAGRNISVTHIALGTTRVQNTIATLGQAVGTAAAMCVKLGQTPRGIYQNHMKALQQQLIKDDQYIPGLKNEDPGDPCLTAAAAASSVKKSEVYVGKHGANGPAVPLDQARGTISGFSPKYGDIKCIYVKLRSELEQPRRLKLFAKPIGDLDTVDTGENVYSAEAEVPAMSEGWVCFPVYIPIRPEDFKDGSYLQLWMEKAEGIGWCSLVKLSNYRKVGTRNETGRWVWTAGQSYCFSLKKPADVFADCRPENVINGYSRILAADRYEWVSDPAQSLPQWLELKFREAAPITSVSLVFDTDMTNPGTCTGPKTPWVETCVKDYTVEVFDGKAWVKVAEVEGNFMRKRTHTFETVTAEKIRVTVKATCGDPSARIIEVRASV